MAKKKYYETDEFKSLQKNWYAKIGEEVEKNESVIVPETIETFKTQYLGGLDYAAFCEQILREFKFKKDIHRIIFEKHAEGKSRREIQDFLFQTHAFEISDKNVDLVVNRIKKQFLTENYSK
jgi:hypothetical protein